MLRKERRLYPRHSLRRKRLPVRNANHPSDGHKLRNDRSVAVHFQVAFTQKPAGICVLFPGQSIRGSGVFYAAAWRVSRQWPKTPVRAPFASREKRRPLANRAFEAHALCGKRMSDAPYGNQASKPVLASPSRRLAGIPIGGRWEQNPAQRLSRRRLQPPVLLERRFCEKRMPDALYGNQASKSILASPSRRLTENPTGGRWEQNLVQSLVAATSPTVRSFGVLFLRKADARCAIRKSSVEAYLGVSFPAAGREPDRAGGRWEQNPAQRLIVAMFPTARSFGALFLRKTDVRCAIRKSSVEACLGVSFPAAGRYSGRRERNPVQRLSRRFRIACPIGSRNSKSCASAGHAQD